MPQTCDVAIIGAGPAGLAAADMLAGRGLGVRLLDESHHVGGQLLRCPTGGGPVKTAGGIDRTRGHGFRLMDRVARKGVRIETGVQVLGIFPENRLLVQGADGRVVEMASRCIVCATGARERFLPFPGWTLPGAISTGAAQIMLKSAGIRPGGTTLVAGLGPLPLLLAVQLAAHGGRVATVANGSSWRAMLGLLRRLPRQADNIAQGIGLMACLAAVGVPLRFNRWIIAAEGKQRLETVIVARMDSTGRIVAGSQHAYPAACLAVGFGFVPNLELLLQAGCDADHCAGRGGWVIRTDDRLETSQPNLFAAGEVTGIAGGTKALIEGQLCGLSVLETLGGSEKTDGIDRRRLLCRRDHELTFGVLLNRLSRVPADWVNRIDEDTIICRCEDVRLKDIRRLVARGFATVGAIKKATRCGMGNCQGRICGPMVADILGALSGGDAGEHLPTSTRSPVKMVSLGALATMEKMAEDVNVRPADHRWTFSRCETDF